MIAVYNDEYIVTSNIGLKLVGNEEIATSKTDTTETSQTVAGAKKKKTSVYKPTTKAVKANRNKN